MNDGMYTNLRNYLEEIASQNKQLLAESKRTNELLEKLNAPTTASKTKGATSEFVEGTDKSKTGQAKPVGPVTVETVKEEPLKTTETVEVKAASKGPNPNAPHGMGGKKPAKSEPVEMAVRPPSAVEEKGAQKSGTKTKSGPTPDVNWNS